VRILLGYERDTEERTVSSMVSTASFLLKPLPRSSERQVWKSICPDLRVGAVAAVAAVGTDELAMEAVHLRAADLAVLPRRSQYFGGLRLLCTLFIHTPEYMATARL
jgi:hypothetical protein